MQPLDESQELESRAREALVGPKTETYRLCRQSRLLYRLMILERA